MFASATPPCLREPTAGGRPLVRFAALVEHLIRA